MLAKIYISHSEHNWDVTTYVDDYEWEGFYETFTTKSKALKVANKIKKELFETETEISEIEMIIDFKHGLENDIKSFKSGMYRDVGFVLPRFA